MEALPATLRPGPQVQPVLSPHPPADWRRLREAEGWREPGAPVTAHPQGLRPGGFPTTANILRTASTLLELQLLETPFPERASHKVPLRELRVWEMGLHTPELPLGVLGLRGFPAPASEPASWARCRREAASCRRPAQVLLFL